MNCNDCRNKYELVKLDYSKGGCIHTDMEGFCCMAFADEGQANWMVGLTGEGQCECWSKKDE